MIGSSTFRNSECFKVLLSPNQPGDVADSILLERALRPQIGDQILMQLLESFSIFTGQDGGLGIYPVFKGWRDSISFGHAEYSLFDCEMREIRTHTADGS